MLNDDTRKKLEDIIGGIVLEGQEDYCTATRNFLCQRFSTSTTVKRNFEGLSAIKEEQVVLLKKYATQTSGWVSHVPDEGLFLAKGGESQVYLHEDNRHVIKLNDGNYYATWLEFFNSILIHNLLFQDTAYTFLGFVEKDNKLMAVLKQSFITADSTVDLSDIKAFLTYNGFKNTRNNDYYSNELGLILEDLHDENVIFQSNKLFFIDTVIYIDLERKKG